MIVVRIMGGLGNQMFQYALGRRLSLEHGRPLKLDVQVYETYDLHGYGLDQYAIDPSYATRKETDRLRHGATNHLHWLVKRLVRGKGPPSSYVRESEAFRFDPKVANATPPTYLNGYWQSERYFESVRDTIRADFALKRPLSNASLAVAEAIKTTPAVSVHVRRGDYANNPATRDVHGLCSLDYYARAIKYLSKQGFEAHYFVFSDDPAWAASNLSLPGTPTYVNHNGPERNYEDMHLMSLCKHHIIANSSFSWWGAWLNPIDNKIVVAPKRWLASERATCPDVCPDAWIRI